MAGSLPCSPETTTTLSTGSAAAAAASLQSCPTVSDPMDCSLPDFSVHGIFQASVLDWGAIAFSEQLRYSWKMEATIYRRK